MAHRHQSRVKGDKRVHPIRFRDKILLFSAKYIDSTHTMDEHCACAKVRNEFRGHMYHLWVKAKK